MKTTTMSSQNRKLIYGLIIVACLGAMIPYTNWLDKEKKNKDLGEAAIGQVDTGSFMLKLALLGGARGVAANVLWTRAEELKREQDWDRMKTTVDLITKLQPHFLSVWTFQGWNLAYNVSVEWDAPEDKYQWIKEGIKFIKAGVQKNRRSPDLLWDTAWTYYHKLGFSDESIIFRRLFRDDDDEEFKTYIEPESKIRVVGNDNFQLAYGWFSRAIWLVDEGETRLTSGTELDYVDPSPQHKGRPGDLAFRSMPAHAQTRYASSLEKMSIKGVPATFGEVAKNEWEKALREWVNFGTYTFESHNVVMKDGKLVHEPIQLDDSTHPDRFVTLTENQQYWTTRWADQMNYRFWKERANAERTNEGVQARQLFYEGTIAYKSGDFPKAAEKFKQGLAVWDKLLQKHPTYRDDEFNKKDTGLIVQRYMLVLKQNGEPIPDDMPFKNLVTANEQFSVDPFDAVEMLGSSAVSESGQAQPGAAPSQPGAAPGQMKAQ
jgi:hypothetical protein